MKKISIISSIVLLSLFTFSDSINWVSYQQAKNLSKLNGKPIFMFIHSPECKWCNLEQNNALTQQNIVDYINTNTIPVDITLVQESDYQKYGIDGIPGNLFINANGICFYSDVGYSSSKSILITLQQGVKQFSTSSGSSILPSGASIPNI